MSLEERLQRLEDREEIRALHVANADALDRRDFAAYASLFTEDGELAAQLGGASGRRSIQELLESAIGDVERPAAFHIVANPEIDVDGDRATSRVLWAYLTHDEDGRPTILQAGHYDDELVRDAGRWRFQRRRITRDFGFSPLHKTEARDGGN
jgi:3-phenylpropionate/cinnamic acid dioxygenase small subunit